MVNFKQDQQTKTILLKEGILWLCRNNSQYTVPGPNQHYFFSV